MESPRVRYRVSVSTSVKGVKTYDCTVDADGLDQADVLNASDVLVSELEKRYGLHSQLEQLNAPASETEQAPREVV